MWQQDCHIKDLALLRSINVTDLCYGVMHALMHTRRCCLESSIWFKLTIYSGALLAMPISTELARVVHFLTSDKVEGHVCVGLLTLKLDSMLST